MKLKILLIVSFITFITLIIYHYNMYYKWATNINIHTIDSYEPGPIILMVGGTHGNEPAGKLALKKLIDSNIKLKKGTLIIIPEANKSGSYFNTRWLLHNFIHSDLNRNYTDNGKEEISKKIIENVNKSDFIVDFHEGWGYRLENPESMGSTLSYTTDKSKIIAQDIIKELNKTIKQDYKKFTINEEEDNLLTLRNYSNRKNKDYILVETTGQNDIQKIETRVNQDMIIINNILSSFNMI